MGAYSVTGTGPGSANQRPAYTPILTHEIADKAVTTEKISDEIATKEYVDNNANLSIKEAVVAATTENIDLCGEQTIDEFVLSVGNRVLVKDQSLLNDNGIYIVSSSDWERSEDTNTIEEIKNTIVYVENGSVNAGTTWALISHPETFDDDIIFSIFTKTEATVAGNGLVRSGQVIDVVGTTNRIVSNTNNIDISSNYAGQTSITTLGTITSGTWSANTIAISKGGTNAITELSAIQNLGTPWNYIQLIDDDVSILLSQRGRLLNIDASTGNLDILLPDAIEAGNGFNISIRKSDNTTNTVTINTFDSQKIYYYSETTELILNSKGQTVTLVSNGSEWVMSSDSLLKMPVSVEQGGTGSDLSETGGTGQYVKQSSVGGNFSVGTISSSDIPTGINATKISDGLISNTEFDCLNGVTSSIQTQLDSKLNSNSDLLTIENVVVVKKNPGPGQFSSISAALASITDNSPSKVYEIRVGPGIYLISSAINMKPYCIIRGSSLLTILTGIGGGSMNLINGSYGTAIYECTLNMGVPSTGYVVYYDGAGASVNQSFTMYLCRITTATNLCKIDGSSTNAVFTAANLSWGGAQSFDHGFEIVGGQFAQVNLRSCVTNANSMTAPLPDYLFKVHGVNSTLSLNSVNCITGTSGSGTCIHAYDGATVITMATLIDGWEKGIWTENIGDAPNIQSSATEFERCTYELYIDHEETIGKFTGYTNRSKSIIQESAPFFITNFDSHIVTVAKKGGDYTSVSEAVNSITTSGSDNRFMVSVGPGIFEEPLIDLTNKPFVSIVGSSIETTKIIPDGNHDIIKIGNNNEISFMWLDGAPSGYAAVYALDSGNYAQLHKITFNDCDIGIYVKSVSIDTTCYAEYVDMNGTFSYATKIESTNGTIAFCSLENYFILPTSNSASSIGTYITGEHAIVEISGCTHTGYSPVINGTIGLLIRNGGICEVTSITIENTSLAISSPNDANPCGVRILSGRLRNNTQDISILNVNTSGNFTGASSHAKIFKASDNTSFIWSFIDVDDGEYEICNELAVTQPLGTHTECLELIKSRQIGLISGGVITAGVGKSINITSAIGYVVNNLGELKKLTTSAVSNLSLDTSNQQYYIYIDQNGNIATSLTSPSQVTTVLIGRVGNCCD